MDKNARVRKVKASIMKELRKLGFTSGQGMNLRTVNGFLQGVASTRNRSIDPEDYERDLQMVVMSPTA